MSCADLLYEHDVFPRLTNRPDAFGFGIVNFGRTSAPVTILTTEAHGSSEGFLLS